MFDSYFSDYLNKKIHIFVATEVELNGGFDDEMFTLSLESYFPAHLIREQKERCIEVFKDLMYWTNDSFMHEMTPFHELALYGFLVSLETERNSDEEQFDSIYYDDEDEKEIREIWNSIKDDNPFEDIFQSVDELKEGLHDISVMLDYCFEDIDFITYPWLIGKLPGEENGVFPQEIFDYFKDLLPADIRLKYENMPTDNNLFSKIDDAVRFIAHGMTYFAWNKNFWNGTTPLNESGVQRQLDVLFNMYFKGLGITDITREADIGTGKIDFKFYVNSTEKALIEVKLGAANLSHGFTKQLAHYMNALQYKDGFYLIICFTKSDLDKANRFLDSKLVLEGKRITTLIRCDRQKDSIKALGLVTFINQIVFKGLKFWFPRVSKVYPWNK